MNPDDGISASGGVCGQKNNSEYAIEDYDDGRLTPPLSQDPFGVLGILGPSGESNGSPQTPPRMVPTTYDNIPTAAVLPQSPLMAARYGSSLPSAVVHQQDSSYMLTLPDVYENHGNLATYRQGSTQQRTNISTDSVMGGMFSLNLSPGSPAPSLGPSVTPPRSPVYSGYEKESDNSGLRSISASPVTSYASISPGNSPKQQHSLYKTELCRSWEECGSCRYSVKCQFAHGREELRPVLRHPKYKTEICRTFAHHNACPYGSRCRFIHYQPEKMQNAVPQQSGLAALVSGVASTTDWSDTFLGTPAPLDPRPARAAAAAKAPSHRETASTTTIGVDSSPASSISTPSPVAIPRRGSAASSGFQAKSLGDVRNDTDDDDDDDDDGGDGDDGDDGDELRRLPIFSTIASSPNRDIFEHKSSD
jgi:butyrate response factor 1